MSDDDFWFALPATLVANFVIRYLEKQNAQTLMDTLVKNPFVAFPKMEESTNDEYPEGW